MHLWNLFDQPHRDIDHPVNTLQLWYVCGLLNNLRGNLSLRQNRDVHDFVGELQLWDLLLDDGFLHCLLDDSGPLYFNCVEDVLNVRVHISGRGLSVHRGSNTRCKLRQLERMLALRKFSDLPDSPEFGQTSTWRQHWPRQLQKRGLSESVTERFSAGCLLWDHCSGLRIGVQLFRPTVGGGLELHGFGLAISRCVFKCRCVFRESVLRHLQVRGVGGQLALRLIQRMLGSFKILCVELQFILQELLTHLEVAASCHLSPACFSHLRLGLRFQVLRSLHDEPAVTLVHWVSAMLRVLFNGVIRNVGFEILFLISRLWRPFIAVGRATQLWRGFRLPPVDQVRGRGVHPDCAIEPALRYHVGWIWCALGVTCLFSDATWANGSALEWWSRACRGDKRVTTERVNQVGECWGVFMGALSRQNMTQRIELFLKIWLKEFFFFLKLWLKELNSFSGVTQRIELFFWCDSKNWTSFLYDSKNWTFFLNVTQIIEPFWNVTPRIEPFFLNVTQRVELFFNVTPRIELFFLKNETLRNEPFPIWLKDWIFFNMTQELNLLFLYDSMNWTFV